MGIKSEFQRGQLERACYPLRAGRYKLDELLYWLSRYDQNIENLMRFKLRGKSSHPFDGCLWGDRSIWLKTLLPDLAFRAGYELLPAVRALREDGLEEQVVIEILGFLKPELEKFLGDTEATYTLIRRSIGVEYAEWKLGRSLVRERVEALSRLVRYALWRANYHDQE